MGPLRWVAAKISPVYWAIALSVLVHALLLSSPAWDLPIHREPIRIEASLLKTPAVRTATTAPETPQPEVPKPHKKTKAQPPKTSAHRPAVIAQTPAPQPVASVVVQDSTPPREESTVGGSETMAPSGETPSKPVAPSPVSVNPEATQAWPKKGRIRFQVRYGETIEVGQMVHTWSHDGEHYTMRSEAETVGVARLIKRFKGVQQSQGRVGPEGLAPDGFEEDLNGKESHAVFDWSARRVVMYRPDRVREVAFEDMAQDLLSLAHHLAFQPDGIEQMSLYVVGGRWGAEATLTQVANERLQLPWGTIETRHFNCVARNGEFVVDLWLARQYRNAPVRIRVDDRKQGHVVDEIALEIELDGVKVDLQPPREMTDLYKG